MIRDDQKLVYFMKPIGMAGPIKIGCSCQPEGRLKSLDIWSPFPLELIVTVPGCNLHEGRLHWRFRDSHSHGEWFHTTADLLSLIDHVRLNGSLPPLEARPPRNERTSPPREPNRNPEWKQAKAALTKSIRTAEIHAYGWGGMWRRPVHILKLTESYLGAFNPPPTGESLATLEAYRSELRSLPKCKTPWKEALEINRSFREGRKAA